MKQGSFINNEADEALPLRLQEEHVGKRHWHSWIELPLLSLAFSLVLSCACAPLRPSHGKASALALANTLRLRGLKEEGAAGSCRAGVVCMGRMKQLLKSGGGWRV